jgi:hypothetical protein
VANWASEIAADTFAFAHTGYAAVAALSDVVSGRGSQVFRFLPEDVHPIAYLRVLLGAGLPLHQAQRSGRYPLRIDKVGEPAPTETRQRRQQREIDDARQQRAHCGHHAGDERRRISERMQLLPSTG